MMFFPCFFFLLKDKMSAVVLDLIHKAIRGLLSIPWGYLEKKVAFLFFMTF